MWNLAAEYLLSHLSMTNQKGECTEDEDKPEMVSSYQRVGHFIFFCWCNNSFISVYLPFLLSIFITAVSISPLYHICLIVVHYVIKLRTGGGGLLVIDVLVSVVDGEVKWAVVLVVQLVGGLPLLLEYHFYEIWVQTVHVDNYNAAIAGLSGALHICTLAEQYSVLVILHTDHCAKRSYPVSPPPSLFL